MRRLVLTLILAGAATAAYWPALHGGWLWDDPSEVSQNALLRDPHGPVKIWLGEGTPDYFPLKTSIQWAQWHLWGDRVTGYHLTNLALHVLASLLAWRLFSRLGAGEGYLGGLLFAVHPLAVGSVAWISEFKNTLSLPLALMSVLAYLEYDDAKMQAGPDRPALPAYGLSLLFFIAAMLAKTSVAMLPPIFLLLVFWRRGAVRARDAYAVAPFFAVSAVLGLVTVYFQAERVMTQLQMPAEGPLTRWAGAGWAVWFYAAKSVLPVGLLPIYPRWSLQPALLWMIPPWACLVGVFAWFWRRRATWGRHALLGFGSFVLNLAPVLGLVPMAFLRISRVSDHFAYLPLVSIAGLAAAAASAARSKVRPAAAVRVLGCVVASAGLLASRGYARNFAGEEALWTYTVERNPAAWLAQNNLGILLAQSGRPAEAVSHLEAAVALQPRLFGAQINLGRALAQEGRLEDAIPHFAAAFRLEPGNADARDSLRAALNNHGNALARAGRLEEAVAEFRRALDVDPANAGVHRNLGFALQALGRGAEAAAEFNQADRIGGRN